MIIRSSCHAAFLIKLSDAAFRYLLIASNLKSEKIYSSFEECNSPIKTSCLKVGIDIHVMMFSDDHFKPGIP